jgi:hypothetical protein
LYIEIALISVAILQLLCQVKVRRSSKYKLDRFPLWCLVILLAGCIFQCLNTYFWYDFNLITASPGLELIILKGIC